LFSSIPSCFLIKIIIKQALAAIVFGGTGWGIGRNDKSPIPINSKPAAKKTEQCGQGVFKNVNYGKNE
jgi:hypothetical protein